MRAIKLKLSYDGTQYGGWQIQPNAPTIQAAVEDAIHKVTGDRPKVLASGRTDSGVHALEQIASFHTASALECNVLVRAINAHLAEDIRVLAASEVEIDFHPIRDTIRKRYRYVIQDGRILDVFQRPYAWHIPRHLDLEAMQTALSYFVGTHDFAAFQAVGGDRKTTVRTIDAASIVVLSAGPCRRFGIEISANGFLYNMMRNIVGTLVEVGQGRRTPDWVVHVIESKRREEGGMTAPPQGLFLVRVWYPGDDDSSEPAMSQQNSESR